MYFKRFKTALVVDFAFCVVLGMILINLVVIFLWQQHVIELSVERARLYLVLFEKENISADEVSANRETLSFIENNNLEKGQQPDFAILYHGNNDRIHNNNQLNNAELRKAMLQATASNNEFLQIKGSFLSVLGFGSMEIQMAHPVAQDEHIDAIGVSVHSPVVPEGIGHKLSIISSYILINSLILTTIWFFRMRRLILKPLENLIEMSQTHGVIAPYFLENTHRKNEFGQLAGALSNMIRRIEKDKEKLSSTIKSLEEANECILENQKGLIETEKFAALGKLAAGLAHEIGNPLGIIQGYIELLGRDDINENERWQYRERADKELARVNILIRQLLDLARKKSDHQCRTQIPPLIHELVDMLRQQQSTNTIFFEVDCADFSEQVRCSEADLHQVLLNCLLNSIDAINERKTAKGVIALSCSCNVVENRKWVRIVIRDSGKGISEAELTSIFDPFFTTKPTGSGTGLGLSVSRSIIENAGGTIEVESENSVYTSVTIILPVD